MKVLSLLFVSGTLWAISFGPQSAQEQYRDYDFKKSLLAYTELFKQTPSSATYAIKVAELKFLVEGRASAIQILKEFADKQKTQLSTIERQEINRKIVELSQKFLLEEAQTHYLQAQLKTQLKDWAAALAPIKQAAALEPGNLKVLNLKSEIEQRQGLAGPAYQSLKDAYQIDPQSEKLIERLSEAHVFHGHFEEVKTLLEKKEKHGLSPRNKMALAVAKWELGKKSEAKKLIDELSRNRKNESTLSPALAWMIFRIETEDSSDTKEAKVALKNFLKLATPPEKVLIDGWDPYRLLLQIDKLTS